ncbi:hypothetical protein [Vibrio anguillarum]|uniref:hypothetical protein n=1 Tax=Vibrio anguillarum TaxID=55601 RepID=UPI003013A8C4
MDSSLWPIVAGYQCKVVVMPKSCIGKCTQYKMDVKAAQQEGKDISTITVPEGCEAITEK